MKFTFGWLQEHLETGCNLAEVVDRLTMIGLEVEEVTDLEQELKDFVVGHVTAVEPHPNADRLHLCDVDIGSGTYQVVCGAPNVRSEMKTVFAPIGTHIPGANFILQSRKIRGISGQGMLCSEKELGLGQNHSGIIELDDGVAPGEPFVRAAGLDDPVIQIAITPNRGDCLGVQGIARDLAASSLGKLITPNVRPVSAEFKSPIAVSLRFSAKTADACPYLVGRMVRGVKNGPSPAWLRRRLSAIGLRPISKLVDVTNLLTYDRCRPLHAFDADKVKGDIHVRLADAGETIETLDDHTHHLTVDMTVICDDLGPIAIAGVIGGVRTSCTETTTNVFLESALFNTTRTAVTGRRLNIESDARYRFERGIDPAGVIPGIEMATQLFIDLGGGEASTLVTAGALPEEMGAIEFRSQRVSDLGGLSVPDKECREILERLGFSCVVQAGSLRVLRPSWRHDVDGEADLVEEILRIKGYDSIPPVSLDRNSLPLPALSPAQRRVRTARRLLASRNLNECVTWSFVSKAQADRFGGGSPQLKLSNPITEDLSDLRPSLLPNLLTAVVRNTVKGRPNLGLFEIGPQFLGDTEEGQEIVAGILRSASLVGRHWLSGRRNVDVFDVKADCLGLLEDFGLAAEDLSLSAGAPDWYHPGRSGQIKLGPKAVLGYFGELHPNILSEFDLEGQVVGAEIFLGNVRIPRLKESRVRPVLSSLDLPSVDRDFAFVVKADIQVGELLRAIRSVSGKDSTKSTFSEVSLFDVYTGKGIAADSKSVALGVTINPQLETLTDKDIRRISDLIIEKVEKVTGGTLRQ
jgi:phenylalanyl-tRNA synthetase beta chain